MSKENGTNKLYWGDNLKFLRQMESKSITLFALDPPFQSGGSYPKSNIDSEEMLGSSATSQAYEDTWHWGPEAKKQYEEILKKSSDLSDFMRGIQVFLKPKEPTKKTIKGKEVLVSTSGSSMMAYLCFMAPRLVEMQRLLTDDGSIYLHCDDTAYHYLRMLMDSIFGESNYRNTIIWKYKGWSVKMTNFQRHHDTILRYSKSSEVIWNQLFVPKSEKTVKREGTNKTGFTELDEHGKKHHSRKTNSISKNRNIEILIDGHLVQSTDDAIIKWKCPHCQNGNEKKHTHLVKVLDIPVTAMPDVWEIPRLIGTSREWAGFSTQKPEALYEVIVKASSNPGDWVCDPFLGSGTTVRVSQRLKRKWIGIDILPVSINTTIKKFKEIGGGVDYKIVNWPADPYSLKELATENFIKFKEYLLARSGSRFGNEISDEERVDGVDGILGKEGGEEFIVIVGLDVTLSGIKELVKIVEVKKARGGIFISLKKPTSSIETEAEKYGSTEANLKKEGIFSPTVPKIAVVHAEELLKKEIQDILVNYKLKGEK